MHGVTDSTENVVKPFHWEKRETKYAGSKDRIGACNTRTSTRPAISCGCTLPGTWISGALRAERPLTRPQSVEMPPLLLMESTNTMLDSSFASAGTQEEHALSLPSSHLAAASVNILDASEQGLQYHHELHGSRLTPARGTKGMFSRTDVQKTSAGVGFQHIGQRRPILGGRLFDYLLALKWVMDVQKTSAGLGFQHIGRGGFSACLATQSFLRGRLFDYLLALKWVMDVQKTSARLGFQHIGQLFPTWGAGCLSTCSHQVDQVVVK